MKQEEPKAQKQTTGPQKRELEGVVVSTAMKNTIVVDVVHESRHPLYRKMVKRTKKFAAHILDGEQVSVGDIVKIAETRPISKTKHFRYVSKITR